MAIGDEQGSSRRQQELKAMREEAKKSQEAINFLNQSIKETQAQLAAVGGKDFMAVANTNVDSLSKRLASVTVETLKSSKARKTFENDLVKAQEQEAANQAVLNNLKREQEKLIPLISAAEEKAALAREQGEIAYKQTIGDTESKLNQVTEERKRLLEEISIAAASGDQNRVKDLTKEIGAVNDSIAVNKKAYDKAKVNADLGKQQAENRAKNYEQEAKDLSKQSSLYQAQSNQLQERNQLLGQSINAGKGLAETIKQINEATPAFIEAFEKFGDIASNIPIIGSAIILVTGEISKASKMFKELKAEGKSSIGAIMEAAKGFTFATLIASLGAFVKMAIDGAKTTSSAIVTLNKSVAGSMVDMSAQMGKTAAAAAKYKVPLEEAASTIAGINDALGMQLDYTTETTQQAIKLTNKYGLGVDTTAKLVKLSAANRDTVTETVDAVTAGVAQFNAMNGVSISTKAIFEDIASASATTLNGIGKQPGAIAAAAAAARSLGMSMEDIRAASESTTDMQKSLTDEMTTEMMLGKQLNLNKLREAALTGDVATQAEEMKRLVMENSARIGNNVHLQEQFASTLGISRDQYNDMLKTQDAMSVLTGKSGAAETANGKARKMTQEEIAKSIADTTGKLTKLGDKIANFQEQMTLGASSFAKGIINGFDGGFFEGIKNIGSMIGDEFGKMTEMGFSNYIKSGSNVGKLLGVLGVGGAGVLTLKAASGLGKSLFGGFKLFGKADGSSPSKGLWIRSVGDKATGILNKLTGKKGDLVKSATSPTGFRDAAGKFAKAPAGGAAGGAGGMLGGIGKGIGDFASGIGKGIEGILSGLAKGISAFAAPQVIPGGIALGVVIAAVSAGVAAASALMGMALPTLAKGFEAIQELDGDALIKAGKGIGAVGLGMAAMGAGSVMGGVGGLIGGITSLFGGPSMSDMFKKVEEFGKNYDFDPVKLENNARGVAAYALGMAALAGGQAASSLGSLASMGGNLADGLVSMFGGTLPLDKVKKFGEYNFDPKRTGNNAKAVANYALGMAALAGGSAASFVGSLANIGSSLADGLVSMFGGTLPLDKVKNFESYDFDAEKIGNNSKAIASYALGMAALAGSQAASFLGSLGNMGAQLVDGLVKTFGGSTGIPYDKIKDLEKANLDGAKIKTNAEALGAYASAMATLAGSNAGSFLGSLGNIGSQLVDGLVNMFGGDTGIPYDEMNEFGKADLDTKGIIKNAGALKAFGEAMSGLENFDDFADDLDDGIGDLSSSIKRINKLKDPDMAKLTSVRSMDKMVKDIAAIDLSNVDTTLDRLDRFSEVLGGGVLKVDLEAVTTIETEMQELKGVINTTSRNEIAELKNQNSIMEKSHQKELTELRNQTALLFEYITKPQKSIIKMNTFKVGQSLTKV